MAPSTLCSYYELLGIARNATVDEIWKAYRRILEEEEEEEDDDVIIDKKEEADEEEGTQHNKEQSIMMDKQGKFLDRDNTGHKKDNLWTIPLIQTMLKLKNNKSMIILPAYQ